METKHCNGCDQDKPLSEFNYRYTGRKAGKPRSHCRECERAEGAIHRQTHPKTPDEKLKASQRSKLWRESHLDHCKERDKQYDRSHREERIAYLRKYRQDLYAKGIKTPMEKAKYSGAWLGIHIAERILSKYFEDITRMPNGNPGYDFICKRGYKIDAKCSCLVSSRRQKPHWSFCIRKNKTADYFIFLAFNNRECLEPLHVWLVPGNVVNGKTRQVISDLPSSLSKWAEYEKPLDKVIQCCDAMKEGITI